MDDVKVGLAFSEALDKLAEAHGGEPLDERFEPPDAARCPRTFTEARPCAPGLHPCHGSRIMEVHDPRVSGVRQPL